MKKQKVSDENEEQEEEQGEPTKKQRKPVDGGKLEGKRKRRLKSRENRCSFVDAEENHDEIAGEKKNKTGDDSFETPDIESKSLYVNYPDGKSAANKVASG
jgi:hypothetical protein